MSNPNQGWAELYGEAEEFLLVVKSPQSSHRLSPASVSRGHGLWLILDYINPQLLPLHGGAWAAAGGQAGGWN